MIKKKHWLYHFTELKIDVKEEHKCIQCIHVKVCKQDYNQMCINYHFGTSAESMKYCLSCINHYTRFDREQPILCFKCKYFKRSK